MGMVSVLWVHVPDVSVQIGRSCEPFRTHIAGVICWLFVTTLVQRQVVFGVKSLGAMSAVKYFLVCKRQVTEAVRVQVALVSKSLGAHVA